MRTIEIYHYKTSDGRSHSIAFSYGRDFLCLEEELYVLGHMQPDFNLPAKLEDTNVLAIQYFILLVREVLNHV